MLYIIFPWLVYFITGILYLLKKLPLKKVAAVCHILYAYCHRSSHQSFGILSWRLGFHVWLTLGDWQLALCVLVEKWTWAQGLGSFPWFLHELIKTESVLGLLVGEQREWLRILSETCWFGDWFLFGHWLVWWWFTVGQIQSVLLRTNGVIHCV